MGGNANGELNLLKPLTFTRRSFEVTFSDIAYRAKSLEVFQNSFTAANPGLYVVNVQNYRWIARRGTTATFAFEIVSSHNDEA